MQVVKRKIISKYPHIIAVKCIVYHINLITKDIISIEWIKSIFQKCQKIVSFFYNSHRAGAALHSEIIASFSIGGNLKSSTKTRWDTAWDICESVLCLENSIKLVSILTF